MAKGRSLARRNFDIPKEKPPLIKRPKKRSKKKVIKPKKEVIVVQPVEVNETVIEIAKSSKLKGFRRTHHIDMQLADKLTTDEWALLERTYVQSINPISYNKLATKFGITQETIFIHFKKLDINLPALRKKYQSSHTPQEIQMMTRELEKLYTQHNINITLESLIYFVMTGGRLEEIAKEMKMVDLDKLIRVYKFANDEPDKIIEHRVIGATKPTPKEIEDADFEVLEVIE